MEIRKIKWKKQIKKTKTELRKKYFRGLQIRCGGSSKFKIIFVSISGIKARGQYAFCHGMLNL